MRVTKVIRDYVEREVSAKFDAQLKDLGKDYSEQLQKFSDEADELKTRWIEELNDLAAAYGLSLTMSRYGLRCPVSVDTYVYKDEEKDKEIQETRRRLEARRRDAIEEILLNLELGETTKADLRSAIDSLEV